ncbi:MAG: NAD-dependent epimerase/dehydratase family protein [Patescibacteria group bacterium]
MTSKRGKTVLNKALCLVTGGAGAIGSHLVWVLIEQGAEVDILDDLSTGRLSNLPSAGHVRLFKEDITAPNLAALLRGRRYRYVFHLAAHFANALSVEEPRRNLDVNLLGTLNLLQALDLDGLERFVFASSSCVYGPHGCAEESFPMLPGNLDTPYAIGKLAAEALVGFWHRHYGLPAVILRYFNTYGPHDWPGTARSVIPNFFARALRGQPLQIAGTGDEIRDFTYVADTIAATLAAAANEGAVGGTFNIGTGCGTTIKELGDKINALTGNRAGLVFVSRRTWDRCRERVAQIGRARRVLGYAPSVGLDEGLALTRDWISTRLDCARRQAGNSVIDHSGGASLSPRI